jgi:hypothetical protein
MRPQGRAQVRAGDSADAQQDRFGSLHASRLPTRVTTTPGTGLLHMTTLDTRTPAHPHTRHYEQLPALSRPHCLPVHRHRRPDSAVHAGVRALRHCSRFHRPNVG